MLDFEPLEQGFVVYKGRRIGILLDTNWVLWFRASELATLLGYSDYKQAIRKHVPEKHAENYHRITHRGERLIQSPHILYISEAGFYHLLMKSQKPAALPFASWLAEEALPTLRLYTMTLRKKDLADTIDVLKRKLDGANRVIESLTMRKHAKKYPNGGTVYVIDYSLDGYHAYKVGMTSSMRKRMKMYNSYTLDDVKVLHYVDSACPKALESCVLSVLHHQKLGNKDVFRCDLQTIIDTIDDCLKRIENNKDCECSEMNGGAAHKRLLRSAVVSYSRAIKNERTDIKTRLEDCKADRDELNQLPRTYEAIKKHDHSILKFKRLCETR